MKLWSALKIWSLPKLQNHAVQKCRFCAELKYADHPATTVQVRYAVLAQYRKVGRYFDLACCLYPTAALVRPKDLSDGRAALEAGDFDAFMPVAEFDSMPSGDRCGKTGTAGSVRIFPDNVNHSHVRP